MSFTWLSAVQIIPAPVQQATPTTIKVQKHNKVPRAPRISGEERSSPGNRTGNRQSETPHLMLLILILKNAQKNHVMFIWVTLMDCFK